MALKKNYLSMHYFSRISIHHQFTPTQRKKTINSSEEDNQLIGRRQSTHRKKTINSSEEDNQLIGRRQSTHRKKTINSTEEDNQLNCANILTTMSDKLTKQDNDGGSQKEQPEEQKQQRSECSSSNVGMDSSKLAEKFNKLEVEFASVRRERDALKLENGKLKQQLDKLKEANEALKPGTSQAYLQKSPTESTIASRRFAPGMKPEKPSSMRYFPNWLPDSLAFLDRKQICNSSLSISCELFRQLCWPKLHKIPFLKFIKGRDELGNFRAYLQNDDKEIVPIASIPPPDFITGIEDIVFKFVDGQVVNFVKNIAHLLQYVSLLFCCDTSFNTWKMDKERIASIHALLECLAHKIFNIEMRLPPDDQDPNLLPNLDDFKQLFPGIFGNYQPKEEDQVQDYTHIVFCYC